jgi:hypothetical protein
MQQLTAHLQNVASKSSQTLTNHQDMKTNFSLFLTLFLTLGLFAQSPVISNKNF